jgi:hemoglobin
MSGHTHHSAPPFSEASWDERYRSSAQVWSGQPNPQLVAEISDLAPGRALDVGCGEGADAVWLARRGWEVVAVDISGVAIERAEQHARDVDLEAHGRIEWRRADLLTNPPEPDSFDLVTSQFMQLPPEPRTSLFKALIDAVRPGGTLLIVGHHPSDLGTGVRRPPMPELFYSADDLTPLLDGAWFVDVNEARPRIASSTDDVEVTIHDAVLRATRREASSIFEAAGGIAGILGLARAWHTRVMADEIVSHAFSHGYHPRHTERLAAYWTEALGGPMLYTETYGDETSVVRMHSGNGLHEEMDNRAIACFDQALKDVGFAGDDRLRQTLHDYFAWATTNTMSRYHRSAEDVPEGLHIPHWSWDGLVSS